MKEMDARMLWDVPSMSNSTYSMFLVGGIFTGGRRGPSLLKRWSVVRLLAMNLNLILSDT